LLAALQRGPSHRPTLEVDVRRELVARVRAFTLVSTSKFRVVFTHKGKARSGITEIEAWGK
jgi:hypothetical protein